MGISKTMVRKKSRKDVTQHEIIYMKVQKQVKSKQHTIRDTYIDGRTINKHKGIINKKSRMFALCGIWVEDKWGILGI